MGGVSVACQRSRQPPHSQFLAHGTLGNRITKLEETGRYVTSGAESLLPEAQLLLTECATSECSSCSPSRDVCENCFGKFGDTTDDPVALHTSGNKYVASGTEIPFFRQDGSSSENLSFNDLNLSSSRKHRGLRAQPFVSASGHNESARKKATARICLQEALASNDVESLQTAIEIGEGAGLRAEELEAAQLGLQKLPAQGAASSTGKALSVEVSEEHLIKALARLEQAVQSKDIEMLRAALEESECAGVASRDLEVVRSFIVEHDLKTLVQTNLDKATKARNPQFLKAAIAHGERAWMLGTDLDPARTALAQQEQRREARRNLEAAYASGNLERLRIAVMESELAGVDGKLFGAARKIVDAENRRNAAREDLAAAVNMRDILQLRRALEESQAAGLKEREMQAALDVLRVEEQQVQKGEDATKACVEQTPGATTYSSGNSSASQATVAGQSDLLSPSSGDESLGGGDNLAEHGDRNGLSGGSLSVEVTPKQLHFSQAAHDSTNQPGTEPSSTEPARNCNTFSFAFSPSFSDAHGTQQVPSEDAVIDELLQSPLVSTTTPPPTAHGISTGVSNSCSSGIKQTISSEASGRAAQHQHEKFTEYASLVDALRSHNTLQPHTVLVKGSWLVQCQHLQGVLPRRQELPPEAIWQPDDLLQQLHSSPPRAQIVAVSYCWQTAGHPDPEGEQLKLLSRVIEQRLSHEAAGSPSHSHDLAVFLDWCSLCQAPRTAVEESSFEQALDGMALWYAHQRTAVWLLTTPQHERSWDKGHKDECLEPYERRGWPTFEWAVGSLITPSHDLIDLGLHDERCTDWVAVFQLCKAQRRPPQLPEVFQAELAGKHFAKPADREMLEQKYAETFGEVMAFSWDLNFHSVGWGDAEAVVLAQTLPHCSGISMLHLTGNRIGNAGAIALATVMPMCVQLTVLRLQHNQIGDGGKRQLRLAWQRSGKQDDMLGL